MADLNNEKTIKRLKEMLLPAMAEAYSEQLKDTDC